MLKGLKAVVIAQNVILCKYCVNFGDFNDIIMKSLMKCTTCTALFTIRNYMIFLTPIYDINI